MTNPKKASNPPSVTTVEPAIPFQQVYSEVHASVPTGAPPPALGTIQIDPDALRKDVIKPTRR